MDIVAIILTILLALALPLLALHRFIVTRSRAATVTTEMPLRPIVARYSRVSMLSLITGMVAMSLGCLVVTFIKPAPPAIVLVIMYAGAILFSTALPIWCYRFLFRAGDEVVTVDGAGFCDYRIGPDVIPWRAIKDVTEFRTPKLGELIGFVLKLEEAETTTLRVRSGTKLKAILNATFGFPGYSITMGGLDVDASTMLNAVRAHLAAQGSPRESDRKTIETCTKPAKHESGFA